MIYALTAILGGALGISATYLLSRRQRSRRESKPLPVRRILLPFTGTQVSRRAMDAALRLARVEDATLMPAFLARVPLHLALDSPLPRQCETGMSLLEAIEQRALAQGVPVDARVERGRSYRHALERLLEREPFERVIISATSEPSVGLSGSDIIWVLDRAQAEVLILRPAPEDKRAVTAGEIAGHF